METIILLAPLVGSLICGFGWRLIGEEAGQWTATGLLFLAAFLSWVVFLGHDGEMERIQLLRWIESGSLQTDWAIRLDRLTAIMLVVITTVSALVHLYSFGYMAHDENFREGENYRARFFAYLSFFTFAMLALVTADNLVQMFFGWEGVGLASYLLIGFYYRKASANAAAMKAFVVNRVGDFGFALGIFALFFLVDSIQFSDIFAAAPEIASTQISFSWMNVNAAELIAVLLFIGAAGKSAQLFLHTWLPDAMEGPTPVSALIHAATMVTAGVFLVCRMSPIMEFAPNAMTFVTLIGAFTAFFAATVGLVQTDIKRVIAYSTCSQLGYMFVAAGVGVYSVAMFHLFTHAFFKAMLFLGAGSVIHGMHHEQDMRNHGGLRHKLPYTFWAMMIGTLAITGVGIPLLYLGFPVGFAGFVSKDAIIESAFGAHTGVGTFAFWTLVAAAAMTSFYSWRLMFLTFFGEPRGDRHTHEHAHESPMTMLAPLGVLALGAVFAGMIWYKPFFGDHDKVAKWFGIPAHHEEVHAEETAEVEAVVVSEDEVVVAAAEDAAAEDQGGDHAAIADASASELVARAADGPAPGEGAIYIHPDNHVLDEAHHVPTWVKLSPFFAMLLGLGLAYLMYIRRPDLPGRIAETNAPLYRFLLNKWYFDEIYQAIFVNPSLAIGRFLWKRGDGDVIDGGINGLAMGIVPFFTRQLQRAQSGYLFHYAFGMVIGIALLITIMSIGKMSNLISIVIFLPALAAVILALFLRGDDEAARRNAKWLALIATTATFLISLFILFQFDPSDTGFQFVEERDWLLGLKYKVGVDGISVLFIMLTTFLMPITIASAWDVKVRVKEYMIAFLMLETLMLGVFAALDLVLFYLFFEGGLIPMFLIIGIWGGASRIYAAFKFFLYTFLGSVLMLVAMVAMFSEAGTTDIPTLLAHQFDFGTFSLLGIEIVGGTQTLMWLAFFASFAVKMPMWPVHTWLPDAHVQAPTAGSVVLAAILLKMGGYGFLRFSIPMFPVGSELLGPLVLWLSAIAIIYTSLVAMAQEDMKKLIAYSSVAHMGFVTMGIFAANQQGIDGAIFQMISHGFISGALFLCVGVIYDRMHTRDIDAYGGLVNRMPAYAAVFLLFTMANVGLPGTSGFVGEFLTLMGVFQVNTLVAVFACTGVILSAGYALWLYRRVVMGDLIKESLRSITDMTTREKAVFAPLAFFTILLGICPWLVTDIIGPSVAQMVENHEVATANLTLGHDVAAADH